MADPTPTRTPVLGSTADANPYVPVSWMAVAANIAAGLFLTLLLIFGASAAFKDKKPLVMPSLLIIAAAGVVLSFAARRMIRNSEGTRTGENLANSAWWICVVGGLGYGAYLFGIEYTIKSDAKAEVEGWVKDVMDGDFDSAFYSTIDPASRAVGTRKDLGELKNRFADRHVAFSQMDVVRLAKRNPGACTFQPGGMREWVTRGETIDCVYTGVVKCPEGVFPVEIPLRGSEGAPGADGSVRQWEIVATPTGFVQVKNSAITPYGWRISELEMDGGEFGRVFVNALRQGPVAAPWVYQTMVRPDGNPELWSVVGFLAQYPVWGELHKVLPALTQLHRVPVLALAIAPDYVPHRWDKFFRQPGGAPASENQEKTFLAVWQVSGILPTGSGKGGLLPNNDQLDAHDFLTVTDKAIELRVPCEMPALGSGGQRAYRARVVIACTEPDVLADVKRLRTDVGADPEGKTVPQPADFRKRKYKWRVVAIESDLASYSTTPGPQGATAGMPPGGGGH
jgi:hypothetical protein